MPKLPESYEGWYKMTKGEKVRIDHTDESPELHELHTDYLIEAGWTLEPVYVLTPEQLNGVITIPFMGEPEFTDKVKSLRKELGL